ncbi:hypothetical protein U0C82_15125 [Fulvimarina sp. 2208YS6-2-32]|uniref:Uncharacterized protein n=1 Tax=Fulvimarina uroteuthidis TaxID=3098149 RepID=A0ABU5I512_9HYPH|nr:hypothetical protein [Fulvimarina sp. 2208YS6-2-32]MDY8110473.1 hypothetical protein [Fulvimarina sp. 2208YS6-2-32]
MIAALTATTSAHALSQIVDDNGDGAGNVHEGIVAVPLPPLPGAEIAPEAVRTAPTDRGADPSSSGVPDDAPMPPATDPVAPVPPAAPPLEPPATPPPPGSEIETDGSTGDRLDAVTPTGEDGIETPADRDTDEGAEEAPAVPPREQGVDTIPDGLAAPVSVSPVRYDTDALPAPVRDLRSTLIRIAESGEIERLRPYIEEGPDGTVLSFGDDIGDPIAHLKAQSGDPDGFEMLAILLEVLEAGHVAVEPGSENAIFVWPYFAQTRLDTLTPPQKVELFELVTAGDYQSMVDFGAYNFYRLGITPEGELAYFVAGD